MRETGWIALILLALILGNGLFVMAEIALVASRKSKLQQWAESGDAKAKKALELIGVPSRFLAMVQIGITLINNLTSVYSGVAFSDPLAEFLSAAPLIGHYNKVVAFLIVVAVLTYLQVVLGELLPKSLALRHPEPIARLAAVPMAWVNRVLSPLVAFLSASSDGLLRIFRVKPATDSSMTEEEIGVMLAQGAKAGVFEASQQDMMESVIEMGDRRITSLMTARPDIAWLDADATAEDIQAILSSSPYSRFPVCRDSFDQVLGVVHAKDMLARRLTGQPIDLKTLARPIPTIPDSVDVLKSLEAFRASWETMAFVSDEYGSILGLVTLDDVLRNILGDMAARNLHPAGADATRRSDGSWLVDGTKSTEELKELLGLGALPDEEENAYQTLGGFVMARLGRIPKTGDFFETGGWRYEVVDMDGRRVDKVLLSQKGGGAASP